MKFLCALAVLAALLSSGDAALADNAPTSSASAVYGPRAREVMQHLQADFWDDHRGLYTKTQEDRTPDYVWREAAAFSALVAAARHDPQTYGPLMSRFFHSLDAYWDTKAPIPAYEPAPTRGNGHDKYYDDNAWIVITFLEAYEQTHDRAYLKRAEEVARFVASGWDDQLGGGIWWHQLHKDGSKNACANGPAAVGFLRLARVVPSNQAQKWVTLARKAVDWTTEKLQASDGLYDDRIIVATGEVKKGKLTYNSALMLRAYLGLYRQEGRAEDLQQAKRIAKAADWFADAKTGAYRDAPRFSHFMIEADLDLYRTTHEEYLLDRAKRNADVMYAAWKKDPPADMMSNACLARVLWLLADMETPEGRRLWGEVDGKMPAGPAR